MKSENNLEELDMNSRSWDKVFLSDIMDIIGGGTPKTTIEEYWNGDINWISVKDFNGDSKYITDTEKTITELGLNKSSTKLLQKNDIIISARGTVGALGMISKPMAFNQSCYGLRAKSHINSDFLFYLLKNSIRILQNNTHGSVFNTITRNTFDTIEVKVPDINEQKAIADILSALDDKIELNHQMNETLEEMAQALFKRWFVDFEFPNEDGQPYKSSDGEMVESELGMIPKGWKNGQLEDICGYSSNKIMIEKLDKNNYISTENMLPNKGGIIEASGLPTTSKVTSFNIGDTLISNIRPYFKKIYYCNQNGGCSNDVLCFNPKLKDYTYCLYLYLYEDNFFDYMMSGSKGTKMPRGDKKQIMRYPIVIANSDIYLKFNKIVSPMFEKLLTLKEENKNLIKLRDTLLPKLMSGEIRVSDLC